MMVSIESYVQRGRGRLRQWAVDPRVRTLGKGAACFAAGLVLSAASLANAPQPVVLGMLLAATGWQAAVLALGGCVGYLAFWGQAGMQGLVWLGAGLAVALLLGSRKIVQDMPLLLSAIGGFIVSAAGLAFQVLFEDKTGVPVYLLRVALGAATTRLFSLVLDRRDPVADWAAEGLFVLALAQIVPFPRFSLGYIAAGLLAAGGSFPGAALAGLALDLARITETPMTAVLCLAYMTRMIPGGVKWLRFAAPGVVYLLTMGLCGGTDIVPAFGLAIGGGLAVFLPPRPELTHRRGETGLAQVRLELMAGVLSQTQQLLLEAQGIPIDEEALLFRAQERSCGGCPNRKTCQARLSPLPTTLLHRPLVENTSLPVACKKPGRLILELRRSQEQLRSIKADRERQEEYRWAVVQQYQFLAQYLQQLSDQLPRRGDKLRQRFRPEVAVCSAGKEKANGDRCLWFTGTGCRYYILLCDGMGTGLGAAQEGQTAGSLLRQMLSAGFPAEYALRSVNSLLVLRGRAGAVTMDLAEIRLDTGRTSIYKWGAAPSYLIKDGVHEKIGTAGPPPGLSVTEGREMVERLSLGRGEVLIIFSDGVDGEAALRHVSYAPEEPPGELAAKLLEEGCQESEDDATVAVVRLDPGGLST